jgi:hypothetical protein
MKSELFGEFKVCSRLKLIFRTKSELCSRMKIGLSPMLNNVIGFFFEMLKSIFSGIADRWLYTYSHHIQWFAIRPY